VGFEHAVPEIEGQQTYALDGAATGIGIFKYIVIILLNLLNETKFGEKVRTWHFSELC